MDANTPRIAQKSQQGSRGKESNDDHCAWFVVPRPDRQQTVYIAAVADGVTSTVGGAQASNIAIESIKAALQERSTPSTTISEWLAAAAYHANEEILFEARRNPQWKGMSTTLVLTALVGRKLYIMHLGDSRAYLIRENNIHQLTDDHTWVQEALNAGSITTQEAEQHPGRNQLQRYLGAQSNINVDRGLIDPRSGYLEESLTLCPGDKVLLCTDGIHKRVSAQEIKQVVLAHAGYPQDALEELVATALAKREVDDMTAILIDLPPGRQEAIESTTLRLKTPIPVAQNEQPAHTRSWLTLLLITLIVLLTLLALYLLGVGRDSAALPFAEVIASIQSTYWESCV